MKSNWKKCKISDLGTVVGGSTPSTKDDTNYGGNISWITPKDLSTFNERYIYNGERNITEKGLKSCSTQLMPKNSVLFTSRAPIGYVAIAGKEMCTNQGFKSVIPNENTDYLFLYYLLKFNKDNIENMGSGTTFKEVSGTTMKNIEVLVPESKQEQQRIATILSSIDDKIELNNSLNNNLEQQAQAIYKSWFVDFEPFGGVMPDNWQCIQLDEVADFIGGYSYKGNELQPSKYAMATIKNFERKGGFKLDGYKEIIPSDKCKIDQEAKLYDILVAHTDLTQNADVIGNAELLLCTDKYEKIVFSMDVVKVVPKINMPHFILATMLKSKEFKSHCLGYVNGTTVLHLSKKALPDYIINIPNDLGILSELEQTLKNIYTLISNNLNENIKLIQLRDTLLPKLMSGEIDVSNVDISTDKLSFSGGV